MSERPLPQSPAPTESPCPQPQAPLEATASPADESSSPNPAETASGPPGAAAPQLRERLPPWGDPYGQANGVNPVAAKVLTYHAQEPLSLDSLPEAERCRIQTMVRGGTTSSAFDNELAEKMADAELRRAESAADRKVGEVPIEQGGGLVYENKLTDPQYSPRVLLKYVGAGKEPLLEQLCELVKDESTGDHLLIFVCPECFRRGIPSGFAQCHARASHRAWHIDTREAGQVKSAKNTDKLNGVEFYVSAGIIMDSDILRCDNVNCGGAFKIHRNVMYRV